jgi:hypothetical protein
MTGIFLLFVVGLWIWLIAKASRWVGARVKSPPWRMPATGLVFVGLLVLPIADELVGGLQFRALCAKNASEFQMGVADPQGRTTKLTIGPANRYLENTAIPIRHSRREYRDTTTQELVVAFDSYSATGGLFIHALGISNSNSPLTIGQPSCSPQKQRGQAAHLTFKFKVIN